MKVLFFLSHIQKSLQWEWLAEGFKNKGINQVYIIIGQDKYTTNSILVDDLRKLDIPVYYMPTMNKFDYIKNIFASAKIIKSFKPDIIHTSLPLGNLIGQIAGSITGVKNRVTTCENASWAKDFNNKKQNAIDKIAYRFSKKIITTSFLAEEYLKEHFPAFKNKMTNIFHALKKTDYENVSDERIDKIRAEFQISKDDFIIGVIARYEYWKGHEFINKAAAILKKNNQHKGIKILIFGSEADYFDTAMTQIKEWDIGDIVKYKGYCTDSIALYKVFDIHLHVPINKYVETAGINIIEGMISECPQILTKSGYSYHTAKHLENAYVVGYEDAEAIAKAILFLKNNEPIRNKIAHQAKIDAINNFEIVKKVESHFNLYRELITIR